VKKKTKKEYRDPRDSSNDLETMRSQKTMVAVVMKEKKK
jgi:hypothetical protein